MSKKDKKEEDFYFGEAQENAVIEYAKSTSESERNRLYRKYLCEPLQKMVHIILYRYPIDRGDCSIEELEIDGLSHVVQQLAKYRPGMLNKKGEPVKAYSYLGTIIRNYYKTHSTKSGKKRNTLLDFDEVSDHLESNEDFMYELTTYDDHLTNDSFYKKLFQELSSTIREKIDTSMYLKPNDILVGNSLIDIFDNWENYFFEEINSNVKLTKKYVKDKVLYIIREQSNLMNKDIRCSIKTFIPMYRTVKNEIINDEF